MSNEPETIAYDIERAIEGHASELFIARRASDKQRFLLATFQMRDEDAHALEIEIARALELRQPAIIPVVDFLEDTERLALVFEHVEGVTLERLIEHHKDEALPDAAVFHIAATLFSALHAAHGAKDARGTVVPLVHADLGPHQLFVSWNGEVKLFGVGLSTIFRLAAALGQRSAVAAPFVAPEIAKGAALTVRSNVYSAAVMVWALLARRMPPGDGSPLTPIQKLRPDLPAAVADALQRALTGPLVKRSITAGEVERVLAPLAQGGQEQLQWGIEVLRAIETFDDALLGVQSLPPPKLTGAPPASMPRVMTIPPSAADDDFEAPESESIPISVDELPPRRLLQKPPPRLPPRPKKS
jgi:serine/threonine protein kinase